MSSSPSPPASPDDAGTIPGDDATIGVPDTGVDAAVDTSVADTSAPDTSVDAPPDAPADVGTTYNDFADASSWTTFDTATLDAGAAGFAAAVFDGRYIYFMPYDNGASDGIVTRYDTQGAGGFTSASSYATFDLTTVTPAAKGFAGGAFDGRYVYFVPYGDNTPSITFASTLARFDTQAAGGFADKASYATFDLTTVDPTAPLVKKPEPPVVLPRASFRSSPRTEPISRTWRNAADAGEGRESSRSAVTTARAPISIAS